MPEITIDKARPGMFVTKQVENDKGMVLLPAGSVLNEALIARLTKWGVQSVVYRSDGEDAQSAGTESKPKVLDAEVTKRLEERFSPIIDDPVMKTVFEALKSFLENEDQE